MFFLFFSLKAKLVCGFKSQSNENIARQLQNYTYVHEARGKTVETAAKLQICSRSEGEDSRNSCKITLMFTKRGGRQSKQLQNYTYVHEARGKTVETTANLHLCSRSEGEDSRNSCKITLMFTKRGGRQSKQLQNYVDLEKCLTLFLWK